MDTIKELDLDDLQTSWTDFVDDFDFDVSAPSQEATGSGSGRKDLRVIEIISDSEDGPSCDLPTASGSGLGSGTIFTTGRQPPYRVPGHKGKGKALDTNRKGE